MFFVKIRVPFIVSKIPDAFAATCLLRSVLCEIVTWSRLPPGRRVLRDKPPCDRGYVLYRRATIKFLSTLRRTRFELHRRIVCAFSSVRFELYAPKSASVASPVVVYRNRTSCTRSASRRDPVAVFHFLELNDSPRGGHPMDYSSPDP